MRKQWHPLLVQLLRPLVEEFYEIETNMPVGDLPRSADIVLLRRVRQNNPPFRGLWKSLTTWNVLEYKGPSVSARLGDLDLLIELGLGIHRRLNQQRKKDKLSPLLPQEMTFWYIANHLGRRFLRDCQQLLDTPEPSGSGIWRCPVLQRVVLLVSSADLPVEEDSVPLHIAGKSAPAKELAVARLLLEQTPLLEKYGPLLLTFRSEFFQEIEPMAANVEKRLNAGLRTLIKNMLHAQNLRLEVDPLIDELIEECGEEKIVQRLLAKLTDEQRQELKRRL